MIKLAPQTFETSRRIRPFDHHPLRAFTSSEPVSGRDQSKWIEMPELQKECDLMEKTIAPNTEERIFLAALELAPHVDRHEFLTKKCGGDTKLRMRIEELLAFHQRGDNILDDTSAGRLGSTADLDSIVAGTSIGPYKLLQEIGVGGMGVVFMAEQTEPIRRKVAVKIIKLGMDTRNVIARFEAERQALAMMDHPNITKVFDAGMTTTGRPYFVMELVTGLAITDYCDREKLSLRDRIELFHQVCVGIKHAHQKGIIHRDLKPSNVMVTHYDGVPVPKIIDFGIAKAIDQSLTDKTLFTSYGNMIGTPEYMSPEQAEMSGQDIDTRADVYSLGVLMYELLTGTTPFSHWKKKGIHKICQAICYEEPELASTRVNNLVDTVKEISSNRSTDIRSLKRILRGDMDWILSKCMSKKRGERYESAADLARDVKRYLDGQPVEAVGPKLSYRTSKFVNKHKTAISFATVVLVAMCAATIVSTTFAFKATHAEQLASNRLVEVEQERDRAMAAEQRYKQERDRAKAAERNYKELERTSRIEVAAARALQKYNNTFSERRVQAHYPKRLIHRNGKAVFLSEGNDTVKSSANVVAVGRNVRGGAEPHIVEIETTKGHLTANANPGPQSRTFQIVIGDTGTFKVNRAHGNNNDVHVVGKLVADSNRPHFVIEDEQGPMKILQLLVNEQRELFGPDDEVVANTIIELGNEYLEREDWINAENQYREVRDMLKGHTSGDGRIAKVELMLSKALLNQDKTAAAKKTLANSVVHLKRLGKEVPSELAEVMLELKTEWKEINLELEELADLLPAEAKKHIEETLHKKFQENQAIIKSNLRKIEKKLTTEHQEK